MPSLPEVVLGLAGDADLVLSEIEHTEEAQYKLLADAIRQWQQRRRDAFTACSQLLDDLSESVLPDEQFNDLREQANTLNRLWAFDFPVPAKRLPAAASRLTLGITDKSRFLHYLSKTSAPIHVLRWWGSEPVAHEKVYREQVVLVTAYWIDPPDSNMGPIRYQFTEVKWPNEQGKIPLTGLGESGLLDELRQLYPDRIVMPSHSL